MSQTFQTFQKEQFEISTDPARLNIDTICEFLARSYWADKRSREVIERSIKHSLNFGIYDGDRQIGFARIVSDLATFAYLGDVFISEDYRGQSLGKWLMETITNHPDLQGLRRWSLATRDAHGLYAQYGFTPLSKPDIWMERFEG